MTLLSITIAQLLSGYAIQADGLCIMLSVPWHHAVGCDVAHGCFHCLQISPPHMLTAALFNPDPTKCPPSPAFCFLRLQFLIDFLGSKSQPI